jgi:uncharacterized phage-like protein YoqJ
VSYYQYEVENEDTRRVFRTPEKKTHPRNYSPGKKQYQDQDMWNRVEITPFQLTSEFMF